MGCGCCESLDEHVAKVVDAMPPLTPRQIANLRLLFGIDREARRPRRSSARRVRHLEGRES